MGPYNSLDELNVIASLLHDVFTMFPSAFSIRQRVNTLEKVRKRVHSEGLGFLTKTLPSLGKAFDKALTGSTKLTASEHRFSTMKGSELPSFLGELFSLVFQPDGALLQKPNIEVVGCIRQILLVFYKYELPYTQELENAVIAKFKETEQDLSPVQDRIDLIRQRIETETFTYTRRGKLSRTDPVNVAREAKILLSRVFSTFDPTDIVPRHGPGAVATKQQLWEKFRWTNISANITRSYPLDAYFYASLGHVCDCLQHVNAIAEADLPARVILVPKDSRGPRLISCEPVDYQWIQQGLGKAIVDWLEDCDTTKYSIHFSDQAPNQRGALLGSQTGLYSTLDLKEASDRISLSLVRLLFPEHLYRCLESCRSSCTRLPDEEILKLRKFAPMGSSLCFPILATTIWALLTAGAPDENTRDSILVYGDDVVVPTAYAADATCILEAFGLVINHAKSCTSGFYRESCGTDAFHGVNVTPVRFRTVWTSHPSPSTYTSWIAYANSVRRKGYFSTYELIAGALHRVYGAIPASDMNLSCPSLDEVSDEWRPKRRRTNKDLQKSEWRVLTVESPTIKKNIPGWSMLLRFFTEARRPRYAHDCVEASEPHYCGEQAFCASSYTRRDTGKLVYRWR